MIIGQYFSKLRLLCWVMQVPYPASLLCIIWLTQHSQSKCGLCTEFKQTCNYFLDTHKIISIKMHWRIITCHITSECLVYIYTQRSTGHCTKNWLLWKAFVYLSLLYIQQLLHADKEWIHCIHICNNFQRKIIKLLNIGKDIKIYCAQTHLECRI